MEEQPRRGVRRRKREWYDIGRRKRRVEYRKTNTFISKNLRTIQATETRREKGERR